MFNNFRERSNQCHSKQFSCLCKYRFLAEKLHFFKKSALQFYRTYPRACETFLFLVSPFWSSYKWVKDQRLFFNFIELLQNGVLFQYFGKRSSIFGKKDKIFSGFSLVQYTQSKNTLNCLGERPVYYKCQNSFKTYFLGF